MTTQPVSSSSSSSRYDVFLSFRGEDTRTNFTDHLYKALCDKGIYTFIDRELTRGEEISAALVKAIKESRISLIVFSENYASSRWCLDELVKILQCKESKQQIVLPIFYKVDPSDVRKQTSKFGVAFEGLIESKFKDNEEKVLIWREALTEAANLSGHAFKDGVEYETKFINNIVDGILNQVLSRTHWNVAKYPVEIQSRVQDVERHLNVGGNGRRMVGIWGTSGIGKTTIAKAIWNAIAHKFEGSCFLENVREKSVPDEVQLQEALLHKILGEEMKIQSVDEGIGVIKERLRRKKILLILDDVNELKHLENLAAVGWFGEGSRVITTTQDRGLLERHGIDWIYEVQMLYDDRALELFSLNAFGKSEPPNDYLELVQRAIAYAQGLPLAITLLGSHLRNQGIHRWRNILDSYDYEGPPYTGIQKILQKSYDALDNSMQQVFLDIACFFKGETKDYVLQIVSNSKNKVSRDCIEVLIEKAMITIDYGRIRMHDLLEKLGKDIVHGQSPDDPGERSRLWSPEDVKRVLTGENSGTRKIKGIMLKFSEPDEIRLHSKCFVGMINLEIFINRNVLLSGDIKYLPNELRFIDWGGYRCQLQSLPSEFHQVHLADFNMPGGSIKQLGKFKNMLKLTSMNLSGCHLEKIPDLSGIPNIKYLNLSWCTSLIEVDDSVGRLDKLVQLNLERCVRLTRFATRLRLKSLETLYLSDCKRLESFPEIEVEMESLGILRMNRSGIKELPPSIAHLTGLRELDLCGCFNLTRFATLRLKSLEQLDLRYCERLESLPEIEVEMESLRGLYMCGSGIRELPPSITYLTGLRVMNLHGCFNLTRFATLRLKYLEQLDLSDCERLESFPEIEVEMESLRILKVEGSGIRELPLSIAYLTGLEFLDLRGCYNLLEIPQEVLPPRVGSVFLDNCTSLEKFPKLPLSSEVEDKELSLINCVRLRGYDITEKSILDQVSSHPHSQFKITLPGDEVPKWFSCCKDVTRVKEQYFGKVARCEVCFKIPPNLDWETLRLVLCVVPPNSEIFLQHKGLSFFHECRAEASVHINRKMVQSIFMKAKRTHVALKCIPLLNLSKLHAGEELTRLQQGNMCQIIFQFYDVPTYAKIHCGFHLLGHQVADVSETDVVDRGPTQWLLPDEMAVDDDDMKLDDIHDDQHQDYELPSSSLASKTSLGKRPRECDIGDHEAQWLTLSTGPADHPKRRHIDPNKEPRQ